MKVLIALALVAALAGSTAAPAASDPFDRHSGTVVTIDRIRDVLVVEETGRWDPATERALVTRRAIYFTALTEFKVFVRTTIPGGYAGDFAEFRVNVEALSPGDTVTAECVRVGNVLVALNLIVADAP